MGSAAVHFLVKFGLEQNPFDLARAVDEVKGHDGEIQKSGG